MENTERERRYKKLQLKLEELQKRRNLKFSRKIGIIAGVLFAAVLFFVGSSFAFYKSDIIFMILISVAFGWCCRLCVTIVFEMSENRIRRKMLAYEIENTQNEVEKDIFENSIKMSYKYLDQYYLQIREQAQRGFLVTVSIAVFGAGLISIGIIAMFLGKVTPSYITCASGAITEFVSVIFFYLYNKTVSSMSKYHNKLVLSQNISIALRIADGLPEENSNQAKNIIIKELLKDVNIHLTKSDEE